MEVLLDKKHKNNGLIIAEIMEIPCNISEKAVSSTQDSI